MNFKELNEAWTNVEAKHVMYTTFLKDSEVEESKAWIAELQSSFSEAMEKQVEYIGSKAAKAMIEKQALSQQEAAKKDYEKTLKLIDQAFIKQDTEEAVFRGLLEDTFTLQEACEAERDVSPTLRKVQQVLEALLAGCDKYLEFLSREVASTEVGWILVVQK